MFRAPPPFLSQNNSVNNGRLRDGDRLQVSKQASWLNRDLNSIFLVQVQHYNMLAPFSIFCSCFAYGNLGLYQGPTIHNSVSSFSPTHFNVT